MLLKRVCTYGSKNRVGQEITGFPLFRFYLVSDNPMDMRAIFEPVILLSPLGPVPCRNVS